MTAAALVSMRWRTCVAAASSGLVGILYFNNKHDDSAAGEVTTDEDGRKKDHLPCSDSNKKNFPIRAAAIEAGFVFQDGTVDWHGYEEHLICQRYNGGKPRYDKEEHGNEMDKVRRRDEAIEQEYAPKLAAFDDADEADMKARFQEWMKEYGKSYKNDEEKAWRYEIFKKTAIQADISNASKQNGCRFAAPNGFADSTDEELNRSYIRCDDEYWERYFEKINSIYANEGSFRNQPAVSESAKKAQEATAI